MTSIQRSAADDKAADAEYITAVRGGDTAAFGPLYKRHRGAAYHLARQLVVSPSEAEDLVSESFAKVFTALLAGGGPDSAFRAYLLTSVRNTFYDAVRRGKKLTYTDNLEVHDKGAAFEDPAIKGLDDTLAAKAYASLPERWQTVLWHTEIEGESPAQVAPLLGLTANGAAALAYRAREGLKQAFLQAHVADVAADACKVTSERLGAWSRGGLSKREQTQVDRHLEECDRCARVAAEISDLGSGLRGVVAVLAIGTPALTAAYLAGGSLAKISALAWASAAAPTAGLSKITGLAGGVGVTGTPVAAGTTSTAAGSTAAAGVFAKSGTSAVGAAAGAAAHSTVGLWGAVAGTAAVAAIATVVIVTANFGGPEPTTQDAVAPSTSRSAASPSAPQSPQNSGAPTAPPAPIPPSAPASGGAGSGWDDLENLPSMPAVDDGLLGALPSIGALPPQGGAQTDTADDGPAQPSIPPAPGNGADDQDGDAQGEDDQGSGDPGDDDQGDGDQVDDGNGQGNDDGDSEGPDPTPTPTPTPAPQAPSTPGFTPSPTANITVNYDPTSSTFSSQDVQIAHQGNVGYQQVLLQIPAFGALTGTENPVPTQCAVTIAGESYQPSAEPCGAVAAQLSLLGADGMTAGKTISIVLTIIPGTDISIGPSGEFVDINFATTFAGDPAPAPQNTATELNLTGVPPADGNTSPNGTDGADEDDQDAQDVDPDAATGSGAVAEPPTTAVSPTTVSPESTPPTTTPAPPTTTTPATSPAPTPTPSATE